MFVLDISEVLGGTTIEEAAKDLVQIADITGLIVRAKFCHFCISANPSSNKTPENKKLRIAVIVKDYNKWVQLTQNQKQ